jgi:hypothetical protein
VKVNRRFRGTCRLNFQGRRVSQPRNQREATAARAMLATCFQVVSYLAYFSILKMEVIGFSETSVDFQRTTFSLPSLRASGFNGPMFPAFMALT